MGKAQLKFNYTKEYKRNTVSMTFSLPIELLEELNALQIYEKRFRNRSELVSTVLAEYCEKRKKELGVKNFESAAG